MNAVFERDYVAFSSSWRFLLLRSGFAAGMGLLFLLLVLQAHVADRWTDIGTSLLTTAVTVGAALLALAAPGSFATVLVHARASGSLPVLFATPLTALGIAGGAFLARAGLLLLLVLATCPPLALALFYGGIRGEQIVEAVCGVTAATLLLGAPAFLVSAWARRTASAVVSAYLVGAALIGALTLLGTWAATNIGIEAASAVSPIHAIRRAIDTSGRGVDGRIAGVYALLALSLLAATAAVLIGAWRLDREAHGSDVAPPVLSRRGCRPLRYENPVLDHELRRASMLGPRSPSRGLLALLVLTEAAYVVGVWKGGIESTSINGHFILLAFQLLLLLLAVTAAGATSLAQEKETHAIELLRAAPLAPAHVVAGKLAGVLRSLLPCILVPLLHLGYAAWIGVFRWAAIPAVAAAGMITLAAWATCAVYQSLDQRDPQRAVARTMTLLAIVAVLVAGNIGWPLTGAFQKLDPSVGLGAAFGANPIATSLLPAALLRAGGSTIESALLPPPNGSTIATGLVALGIWLLLHVLFGHMLYRRLARLYRSRFEG